MLNSVLMILLCTLAMAYGWGMRGSILGGEKGAMLPGAFVGLLLARFSGIPALQDNWFLLTTAGACGFFLGGAMTYGETLGLTMQGFGTPGFKRGLAGVFIKGFAWFGVAAQMLGIAVVAGSGTVYSWVDLVFTYLAAIPSYFLGRALLNRPHDPKKNIFPKFYFSKIRYECWGGSLFVFLTFLGLNLIRGDFFTACYSALTALTAGSGWVIAQIVHVYARRGMQMKNGKYLFGKLQEKGYIDAWKCMECMIGGFGGLAMSLFFLLFKNLLPYTADTVEYIFPFAEADIPLSIVWTVLFLINALHILVEPIPKEWKIRELLQWEWITQKEHDTALNQLKKPPFLMQYRKRFVELFEGADFILLGFLPTLFGMLGSAQTARLCAVFVLFWVLTDEICFEQVIYRERKVRYAFRICMLGVSAALLLAVHLKPEFFTAGITLFTYAFSYELLQFLWRQRPVIVKQKKERLGSMKKVILSYGGELSMQAFFLPVCIILDIVALTIV